MQKCPIGITHKNFDLPLCEYKASFPCQYTTLTQSFYRISRSVMENVTIFLVTVPINASLQRSVNFVYRP